MNKRIILGILAMLSIMLLPALGCREHPLITSWRTEGLVEKGGFVSHSISAGGERYKALEVRARVPTGTLDDEVKCEAVESRLLADITIPEDVDLIVINICERTGPSFASSWKSRITTHRVAGRKKLSDELMWQFFSGSKCP